MFVSPQSRRHFLRLLGGAAAALPCAQLLRAAEVRAATVAADRIVFFYVPDGMHQADWGTSGRQWGALGSRQKDCTLLTGVRMDEDTSQQGHPGGAKRLLCGDAGYDTSLDQFLASTLGKAASFPHLYLGASATRQGTIKPDELISWNRGSSPAPEDNPVQAFARIFPNGATFSSSGGTGGVGMPVDDATLARRASVLDTVLEDLNELRGRLPSTEQKKLDRHLEATRAVEQRVQALLSPEPVAMGPAPMVDPDAVASCEASRLDTRGLDGSKLYAADSFPDVLAAQLDVLTHALACGATRVATLQCSHHTSDLFMPFVPSDLKQQSHEASHNNQNVYLEQRVWWMGQLKGFLDRLAERPDPYVSGATLLDRTLVLFCTEINWGPAHGYTDMPFVLAGGTGKGLRKGSELALDSIHHRLYGSLIGMLGASSQGFRDAPQGLSQLGG